MPTRIRFAPQLVFVFLILSAASCSHAPPSAPCALSHERLHAVLWMQRSAEYSANCRQAFRLATANIQQALKDPQHWPEAVTPESPSPNRPTAIILDVDETLLNNTPEETTLIAASKRKFDSSIWNSWEERANAMPLDGAVDFVKYAAAQGVTIFYVTNRTNEAKLRDNLARAQLRRRVLNG